MIVLSRRPGEQIMVGEHAEVVVTLLSVSRGVVRVGVEAPGDVRIRRVSRQRKE